MSRFCQALEVGRARSFLVAWIRATRPLLSDLPMRARNCPSTPPKEAHSMCSRFLRSAVVLWIVVPAALCFANELKVCADPDALPFSNQAGQGFENRLAEMLGQDLHV